MSAITLRRPRKAGKNWILTADVRLPHGAKVTVHATVTPELRDWAMDQGAAIARAAASGMQRWLGAASRYVTVDGGWESFGPIGEQARAVLEQLATRPTLAAADPELLAAIEIVTAAYKGHPRALAYVAEHRGEDYIEAGGAAYAILESDIDLADAAQDLYRASKQGDTASRNILAALCAIEGDKACCCGAPVVYSYDAEAALLGPDEAADSIAGFLDHHARFSLAAKGKRNMAPAAYARELDRALHAARYSSFAVPPGIRPQLHGPTGIELNH